MSENPKEAISRLKELFGVETDAELARALKIDKSTIASWKSRGRVPQRFVDISNGDNSLALGAAPVKWSSQENAALALALLRYATIYRPLLDNPKFEEVMRLVSRPGDLWTLFSQAQRDLVEKCDAGLPTGESALAVLVHECLSEMDQTRDEAVKCVLNGRPSVGMSDGSLVDEFGKPLSGYL